MDTVQKWTHRGEDSGRDWNEVHDPSDGTSLGYLQMASTNGLDILPQAVSRKTQIEVQFLTKVLKSIFSTVWDPILRQYSIISRNSCGNFDDNSIRTRLAWSREHRSWKNHKFIIYSSSFGGRRQRRQPVNYLLTAQQCWQCGMLQGTQQLKKIMNLYYIPAVLEVGGRGGSL